MTLEPQNSNQIRTLFSPHPILPAVDREEFNFAIHEGSTLLDVLDQMPIKARSLDLHAFINDELVPRSEWGTRKVHQGEMIILKQRMRGGDTGSMILMVVAMIALTVFTMGSATALGGATLAGMTGLTGTSLLIAQATVMIAGSLLISALFAPSTPKGAKREDQSYSISGSQNSARIGEPLPLVVGTVKVAPDLVARPFTDQTSDDMFLNQIFGYGYGNLQIANTRIGDTNIDDFQEVAYQWSDANGALTLFPTNVDSVDGGELNYEDGWVTRTTSLDTTRIGIDIGGALFRTDDEGKFQDLSVDVEIQISPHGANTWTAWTAGVTANGYGSAITGTFTRNSATTFVNGVATIVHGRSKPLRWSTEQAVNKGQYDVRVRRVSQTYTSTKKTASLNWVGMRNYQPDDGNYNYQTRLAVRIRATGQLNSTVQSLTSIVSARIPTWNGSTWVTQVSSNPAWIYLYLARGQKDGGRRLWGAALPDSRIDIEQIKSWGAWCDSHGLECNFAFGSSMTVYEMLALVARCGRASPAWSRGTLGVVWDAENLPISGYFGPSNIIADSFNVAYISKDLADEITVNFYNKDLDYALDQVRVAVANTASPINPVEIQIDGITNWQQAQKEANLMAARQIYHRRRTSFDTDIEGLTVSRGDCITVSHDLTGWAQSGRLISGNTTHLQLDRDVEFTSANTPYIGIRTPSGTYSIKAVVNPYANANVTTSSITLASALAFDPNADTENDPRDYIFNFGFSETPGKRMKIVNIQPSDENRVSITAIDDEPAYYAAETGLPNTYTPPVLTDYTSSPVSNVEVTEEFQGYDKPLKLYVTYKLNQAKGVFVQTSYNNARYVDYGEVQGASFEIEFASWKVNDQVAFYLVPIGLDSKYQTYATTTITYFIKGLTTAVEGINLPEVSGLELFGQGNDNQFGGKDAVFVWRKAQTVKEEIGSETLGADTGAVDTFFADYEVKIFNTDGTLRRTEYVTQETYTYTYEKNVEDGNGQAARTFRITVAYRSKTNQVGKPATMVATNPAPAAPTGLSVTTITKTLYVQCNRPADVDIQGMEVHVGASAGFTPNTSTEVHRGPESSVTLDAAVTGIDYGVSKYVKVGWYDGFSNTAVNYSSANTVTAAKLNDTDIQVQINLNRLGIAGDTINWTDPPTADMGSGQWVLLSGNVANSNVSANGAGPFTTTTPVMTIKGNGSSGGWYSLWKTPFDITGSRSYIAYVWVKKRSAGTTGGLYVGWDTDGDVATIAGAQDTNPYFVNNAGSTMTAGQWMLAVGVLHANSATASISLAGLYHPSNGTNILAGTEYKHYTGNVTAGFLRFGFYGSSAFSSSDGFDFASPQVHLMDGAEPSIDYLLRRSYQQGELAKLSNVSIAQFATGIEPVQLVTSLPAFKTGNANTVFLTTTGTLYRWNGASYVSAIANTEISGTFTDAQLQAIAAAKLTGQITTTQITDSAISTAKLAAGAVTTNELAANSVVAAKIAAGAVTSNAISANSISGDRIVTNTLDASKILANSITAGKIAAGAIGADQIAAGAITASKIAIGDYSNIVPDAEMADSNAWTNSGSAWSSWGTPSGSDAGFRSTRYMIISGSAGVYAGFPVSRWIPCEAGQTYWVSAQMRVAAGSGNAYWNMDFNTSQSESGITYGNYNNTSSSSLTDVSAQITVPAGMKYMRIRFFKNNDSATQVNVGGAIIRRAAHGELIVDGAVTASKITVANLSAVKADMGAITAGTIALDSTGWIRSGQSGYNTGTGFWLGKDGSTTKFSIGNASDKALTWDGTNLEVKGKLTANTGSSANVRIEIDPSNDLIMWAGIGTKSSNTQNANTKFFVAANGQAFFGGDILGSFRPMAWLRFYSNSNGAFITRQKNIASITRQDTGRYTVTFANALPNKYYVVVGNGNRYDDNSSGGPQVFSTHTHSTTSFQIACVGTGGSFNDLRYCNLVVFGSYDTETDTIPPTSYDPYNDPGVGSNWSRTTNSGTLVP